MSNGTPITLPLHLRAGHLFLELSGELWLIDTGAPSSFGESRDLSLAGERFPLGSDYLGLTAATLSEFVGVDCVGLLGGNVLGRFDHLFDTAGGRIILSAGELGHDGRSLPLEDFMGIPIVTARIAGSDCRMFFDTGAQYSYFEGDGLEDYPAAGNVTDFYPGLGRFETELREVPVSLGGVPFNLRCGTLPGLMGMTLMMASTVGIVGNEILSQRTVGYFPRRRRMVL
jgi:hypothetical protein